MVRGVCVNRASCHRSTVSAALDRYRAEVIPTRRSSTVKRQRALSNLVREGPGDYSLVSLNPTTISSYRIGITRQHRWREAAAKAARQRAGVGSAADRTAPVGPHPIGEVAEGALQQLRAMVTDTGGPSR